MGKLIDRMHLKQAQIIADSGEKYILINVYFLLFNDIDYKVEILKCNGILLVLEHQ